MLTVRALLALAFVVGFVFVRQLAAVACDEDVVAEADAWNSSVELQGVRSCPSDAEVPNTATHTGPTLVSTEEPRPVFAFEPLWGTHPATGEVCLDLVLSDTVTVNSSIGLLWEARMLEMFHDPRLDDVEHRWCDASSNALIADPSPEVHEFVRSIPLPQPAITIDPGYALTGMPAYLEIHDQDAFTTAGAIPGFGGLTASLEPVAFIVDWGDGTVEVVADGRTGAPWDGPEEQQISHVYIHADDAAQVTVVARWSANWQVGGFSGTVDDLQVTAVLELPIEARQSVRVAD